VKLVAAVLTTGMLLTAGTSHAQGCPGCTGKEIYDPAASHKNKHKDLRDYIIKLPPLPSGPTAGYFDNCFVKDKKDHKHAKADKIYMARLDHRDTICFVNETKDRYRLTFDTWPFEPHPRPEEIIVESNSCSSAYSLDSTWASSGGKPETSIHTSVWKNGGWKPVGKKSPAKSSRKRPAVVLGIHQVGPVVAGDD